MTTYEEDIRKLYALHPRIAGVISNEEIIITEVPDTVNTKTIASMMYEVLCQILEDDGIQVDRDILNNFYDARALIDVYKWLSPDNLIAFVVNYIDTSSLAEDLISILSDNDTSSVIQSMFALIGNVSGNTTVATRLNSLYGMVSGTEEYIENMASKLEELLVVEDSDVLDDEVLAVLSDMRSMVGKLLSAIYEHTEITAPVDYTIGRLSQIISDLPTTVVTNAINKYPIAHKYVKDYIRRRWSVRKDFIGYFNDKEMSEADIVHVLVVAHVLNSIFGTMIEPDEVLAIMNTREKVTAEKVLGVLNAFIG